MVGKKHTLEKPKYYCKENKLNGKLRITFREGKKLSLLKIALKKVKSKPDQER